MKNYIKPMMNVEQFSNENVLTTSSVKPEPEKVSADALIDNLLGTKEYGETFSFDLR